MEILVLHYIKKCLQILKFEDFHWLTISFTKGTLSPINISLSPSSLYVMNPPTNQNWLHSIIKDNKIGNSRISLTFRNYSA